MQTLRDRLTAYCEKNNKDIPFGKHLMAISNAVIEAIKATGKYDTVKKKNEPFEVNNYPKNLIPVIDEVIDRFFTNKQEVMNMYSKHQKRKQRYFNYDMEDFKAPAFENAAKVLDIEITQNFNKNGLVQFRVPINDPAKLIKLGKVFQKFRMKQNYERRKQRDNTQQSASKYVQ